MVALISVIFISFERLQIIVHLSFSIWSVARFYFVFVRVISWIACLAENEEDPRNHTNEHEQEATNGK